MAFPREKSPAEDMRAIWAEFRRLRREMSAAHAAIDPGKSLEVRNGAGAPVAKVGHDGGSAGLLVPDGSGGWRTVQVDAQARVDALEAAQEPRFSGIEGDITALQTATSGLGGLQTTVSTLVAENVVVKAYQNALAAYLETLRVWLGNNVGGTPPVRPIPPWDST